MAKKISLFRAVLDHVLDGILGRKYYFLLVHYPNIRVRPNDAAVKPRPLYETTSNIFFTYDEAYEYLKKFADSGDPTEYLVTDEIHSFRSHKNIPAWSKYFDMLHQEAGYKSRLI